MAEGGLDSRMFWKHVTVPGFSQKCINKENFRFLEKAVGWYIALEHVSGTCERTLSQAKHAALRHSGPIEELNDAT